MQPRLLVLLFVAVLSGLVAGFVGNATAGKSKSLRVRVTAPFPYRLGPCPIPAVFRTAFVRASHETRLPLAMLLAVAKVESDFQPDARSNAGAHGLLQLMPATAASLDLDASHPASNVLAGARYLRQMLDRFQSTDLALAAYNAGPTAVEQANGPPSKTTADYVADVTRHWRAFNGCK